MVSSSLAWGDFDNDNLLDFLVTGSTTTQLWRNTGSGFTRVTVPGLAGVGEGAVAWGDYDNDGWPDLLIMGTKYSMYASEGPTSAEGAVTQLWHNTGNGFENVEIDGLPACYGGNVAWGDLNNDGRLDFIITGESAAGKVTQVWRNTGSTFEPLEIPEFAGNLGGTAEWADYNNDGWLDFLVSGGETQATTQLWRNTGGNFALDPSQNLSQVGVPSLAWGDYDRDGRLDYLITGFDGSLEPQDQYFAELWNNLGTATNSPPSAPSGLTISSSSGITTLQWQPAMDDHTQTGGLTYNVRVGTQPGAGDVVSPHADGITGTRRIAAAGNAGHATRYSVQLPPGNYFVSVQAVDNAWAGGAFSPEVTFSTLPTLSFQRQGNKVVITWTNADSDYQLESTDSLDLANWQPELGASNPHSVDVSRNARFFRLRKP